MITYHPDFIQPAQIVNYLVSEDVYQQRTNSDYAEKQKTEFYNKHTCACVLDYYEIREILEALKTPEAEQDLCWGYSVLGAYNNQCWRNKQKSKQD